MYVPITVLHVVTVNYTDVLLIVLLIMDKEYLKDYKGYFYWLVVQSALLWLWRKRKLY